MTFRDYSTGSRVSQLTDRTDGGRFGRRGKVTDPSPTVHWVETGNSVFVFNDSHRLPLSESNTERPGNK